MPKEVIHRFEQNGKRFAIDPETCFCFECDEISWDVLAYYPFTPVNRIYHELGGKYDVKELAEVIGELEWLRATKSIVPVFKLEDMKKLFDVETGLKRVVVRLPGASEPVPVKRGWFGGASVAVHSNTARELGLAAIELLLSRSEAQKELYLEFMEEGSLAHADLAADLVTRALKSAALAGKRLTVAVHVAEVALANVPKALEGHGVDVKLEFHGTAEPGDALRTLAKTVPDATIPRLAKALNPGEGVTGRIIVRPGHPDFGGVVAELDAAGFPVIELDLDGAYVANPELKPADMLPGLSRSAVYYAQRLLEHHYFRLDPIASLFWRIYDGSPMRRADPIATHELAIDEDGAVYPSGRLMGAQEFRLGSIHEGRLDEEEIGRYADYGSMACAPCRQCWARNLCGGGAAATHRALTGSIRTPGQEWCEAQRAWMAAAVAAFNLLSSHGVNFTRIYNSLSRTAKPSLFTLVRAAMGATITMRPIDESDAEMLVRWENWNESAYFLCNESGVLLATKYDREMDSLHPQGLEWETILTRKNGQPIGLMKVRPEPRFPGTAQGWLYLRKEEDYASEEVRKGFRFLLKQAATQQALRRLTVPAAPYEKGLQAFLAAVGFQKAGTQREALYLHGRYHDVDVYAIALE